MDSHVRDALELSRKTYREQMEQSVREAIDRIVSMDKTPSFYNVSNMAQIARSTLYRRPELRQMVEQARSNARFANVPCADPSHDLISENQRLKEENARLKQGLNICITCSRAASNKQADFRFEYALVSYKRAA